MDYRKEKEKRFESIYRLYVNDIYKICLYFTKDEEMAQDMLQQVFFECYINLEAWDAEDIFAYLIRTAKKVTQDIK